MRAPTENVFGWVNYYYLLFLLLPSLPIDRHPFFPKGVCVCVCLLHYTVTANVRHWPQRHRIRLTARILGTFRCLVKYNFRKLRIRQSVGFCRIRVKPTNRTTHFPRRFLVCATRVTRSMEKVVLIKRVKNDNKKKE